MSNSFYKKSEKHSHINSEESVNKRLQTNTSFNLNLSLEEFTDVIGFRVPLKYKIMYRKLNPESRARIKKVLCGLIEAFYTGQRSMTSEDRASIININISIAESKAEAASKAEAKSEVNIDYKMIKLIQKLYEFRDPLPPLQRKLIEQLYRLIEKHLTG